ncbi:Outer membrane protein assembly factor BamA precursor [compost metagenome]
MFDTSCPSSSPECNSINAGDLASSVGVGLTWITALGPLSFSLGMPVKKPENADTQVFQFSLGQTF